MFFEENTNFNFSSTLCIEHFAITNYRCWSKISLYFTRKSLKTVKSNPRKLGLSVWSKNYNICNSFCLENTSKLESFRLHDQSMRIDDQCWRKWTIISTTSNRNEYDFSGSISAQSSGWSNTPVSSFVSWGRFLRFEGIIKMYPRDMNYCVTFQAAFYSF